MFSKRKSVSSVGAMPIASSSQPADVPGAVNSDELSSVLVDRLSSLRALASNRKYGTQFDIDPRNPTRYADIEQQFQLQSSASAPALGKFIKSGIGRLLRKGSKRPQTRRSQGGESGDERDDGSDGDSSDNDMLGGDALGAPTPNAAASEPPESSRVSTAKQNQRLRKDGADTRSVGTELSVYEMRRKQEAKIVEAKLKAMALENLSRFVDAARFNPDQATQTLELPIEVAARYTATRIMPKYHPRIFAKQYLTPLVYDLIHDCFWLVHCLLFVPKSEYEQEVLVQSIAMNNLKLLKPTSLTDSLQGKSRPLRRSEEVKRFSTISQSLKTGGGALENKYVFMDTLPFAISDTVFQLFYYSIAGSRSMYTSRFHVECYLHICRVLTGMEVAPVTVLMQQEKLFPSEIPAEREDNTSNPALMVAPEAVLAIERRAMQASAARKRRRSKSPSKPGAIAPESSVKTEALDETLDEKGWVQVAKSLGYRTVYELFRTTNEHDRDILGLHDAYVAETLRALETKSLIPASVLHAATAAQEAREKHLMTSDWLVTTPRSAASNITSMHRLPALTTSESTATAGIATTDVISSAISPLRARLEATFRGVAFQPEITPIKPALAASASAKTVGITLPPLTTPHSAAPQLDNVEGVWSDSDSESLHTDKDSHHKITGEHEADDEDSATEKQPAAAMTTSATGEAFELSNVPPHKRPLGPEEIAARLIINKSKKKPLAVPFVHNSTSTLLLRAKPDAKPYVNGGLLAIDRTVPVPWAKSGGVDTFKSNAKSMTGRQDVLATQERIRDSVKSLVNETAKAQVATVRMLEEKKQRLLTAGPVQIARAALEVRQERLRRIQNKANEAKRRRDMHATGQSKFMGAAADEDVMKQSTAVTAKADPLSGHATRVPKTSALLS